MLSPAIGIRLSENNKGENADTRISQEPLQKTLRALRSSVCSASLLTQLLISA